MHSCTALASLTIFSPLRNATSLSHNPAHSHSNRIPWTRNCKDRFFSTSSYGRFFPRSSSLHPTSRTTHLLLLLVNSHHSNSENSTTHECWNCSVFLGDKPDSWLICRKCEVIQPPETETNEFDLFGLEPSFNIDEHKLYKTYLRHQRKLHPDRHYSKSQQEQEYSDRHSSKINNAYEVLKDPESRARYLLHLHGKEIGEDAGIGDQEFLVYVLEEREKIEELGQKKDISELKRMYGENETKKREICGQLGIWLSKSNLDLDKAYELTVQLIFVNKLLKEIEEKLPAR